jgi:hypothetical protein
MIHLTLAVAVLFGDPNPNVSLKRGDAGPALLVRNAAGKETKFSVEDLAKLPQTKIEAKDPHSGVTAEYEGVLLHELLGAGGATFGKDLRGPLLASYVLATAKDGYRVVFSIGEVDPNTGGAQLLLAYKKNGKPMTDPEGEFRIVAPQDKRAARWIRQVSSISLHQLPPEAPAKSSK